MKKTTLLTIGLSVLIILNIALLFTVYGGHRHEHAGMGMRGREPKDVIIDKLQFNQDQVQQYEALIKEHRKSINRLDSEIRENKHKLYNLLGTDYKASEKDTIIAGINFCQKQIEETHFSHFESIKKLCTPQQKKLFDSLVPELPELFGPGPQGRPDMRRRP